MVSDPLWAAVRRGRLKDSEVSHCAALTYSCSACLHLMQVLSLEDNEISDWSSLLVLAWLPQLSKLHLSNNPVPNIHYPTTHLTASTSPPPPPPAATTATAESAAAAAAALGAEAESSSAAAGEGQGSVLFAALRSLLLGGCQLSSWADVDQLGRFPALKELRLTGVG